MFKTLLRKRDFYSGGLLLLVGVAVAFSSLNYNLGSLRHMGPGMFPFILGVVLAFIGILILGFALLAPTSEEETILPPREWRGWACILAGPALFIVFGELLGMAPATFACVFVSALGDRTAALKSSAILATAVTFFGVLLFSYALQLPLPIFRWDF